MSQAGGTGANPVITGIVGAVLGAALVAGGFIAFGGDDDPTAPASRAFENEDKDDGGDANAQEVPSGVKLSYRKGRFEVEVTAKRDFCINERKVIVFEEKRRGGPEKLMTLTSDDSGEASEKAKADGTYFARMPESPAAAYGKRFQCLPAISADVKA